MKNITLSLLFSVMFMSLTAGNSPTFCFGLRSYVALSSSGCGAFMTPGAFLQRGRSLLSGGPVVDNKYHVNGFHAGYEFMLVGNNQNTSVGSYHRRLELFSYLSFAYRPSASLTSQTLLVAQDATAGDQIRITELRTKIYEGYAGLGLKVQVLPRVQWATSIGMGAFLSPDCPAYVYHEKGFGMMWRTGLYLNLSPGRSGSF